MEEVEGKLQCGAVCCSMVQCGAAWCSVVQCGAAWCSVLQCGAACCSAVQRVAVRCSVVQRVAVRCSMVQCDAVCGTVSEGRGVVAGTVEILKRQLATLCIYYIQLLYICYIKLL